MLFDSTVVYIMGLSFFFFVFFLECGVGRGCPSVFLIYLCLLLRSLSLRCHLPPLIFSVFVFLSSSLPSFSCLSSQPLLRFSFLFILFVFVNLFLFFFLFFLFPDLLYLPSHPPILSLPFRRLYLLKRYILFCMLINTI